MFARHVGDGYGSSVEMILEEVMANVDVFAAFGWGSVVGDLYS